MVIQLYYHSDNIFVGTDRHVLGISTLLNGQYYTTELIADESLTTSNYATTKLIACVIHV